MVTVLNIITFLSAGFYGILLDPRCRQYFSVNVRRDQSVYGLKETIISKKPHAFKEIDANELVLWKAEIPDEDEAIKAFDINDATEMRSTYEIGEYFTDPPKKHIHIVIKVPGK